MSDSDPKNEADRLRALVDAVPVVLVSLDRELRYRVVNRFYEEHYERAKNPIGKSARVVLGDDAFERVLPALERTLAGKRSDVEAEVTRPGKAPLTVVASYLPTFDAAGKVDGVACFSQDVTEQRASEQRLIALHRISSELGDARSVEGVASTLASIMYESFGATGCTVFVLDSSGLMLERVGTRTQGEMPLAPGPFPLDAPLVSCRAVREKSGIWIGEASAVLSAEVAGRTGLPESALRAVCALPLVSGEHILGSVGMTFGEPHEFTPAERGHALVIARLAGAALERAQLFEAERRARTEAEHANRVKDEFLAMLGHELRNPLAPIRTTLDLMDARGDTTHARERTVIDRQVRHLTRLVDDLLDVSRISTSRLEVQRTRIQLSDVTTQAIEMTMPLIEQRRHHLAVDVASGLVLFGDQTRLAQIVSNVLANAAKYTPNGGHIALSAKANGGEVVLTVRDDGIGIDGALLPQVFDMFAQGPQTSDRKLGGLGLGLAIARSLVELHGGSIRAHSEGASRGTEVVIRLPLAAPAGDVRVPPVVPSAPKGLGRANVLIVDDNEDAGDLLSIALEAKGFVTRVARNGREALAIVEDFTPAVAVLDLGLPEMDGVELAARLRAKKELEKLRLVALTGYGQSADRARTRAAGFDEHLVKPVDLAVLERTVAALAASKPT